MWDLQYNCPTCGAPLPVKNRFVRLATCDFCENLCVLTGGEPVASGMTARVTPLPTPLFLDARGKVEGRPFTVLGRLRYQYDGGYWDEWFIEFEDMSPGWLVEDEGNFLLYDKVSIEEDPPEYGNLRAGQSLMVGDYELFITELGSARIAGGEGQLAFKIFPGEEIQYIDASVGEQKASIEYAAEEVEFCLGRALERQAVVVEDENFAEGWA